MVTTGAAEIPMCGGDVVEDSETTVEIKIRTLDSQTYTLRVNKYVPVPDLKEQIATVTGVLSEQQRLICRGRVLKDDQLLSAYHVEDGHTLHLVVRQPYQSSSTFIGSEGQSGNSAPDGLQNNSSQVSRTVVLEAVNIDQSDLDPTFLNRIMTSILNSFGATNNGNNTASSVNTNIQEANSVRLSRSFGDTGVSGSQNQHVTFQSPQNQPSIQSSQNQTSISSQRMEFDRQQAAFQFPTAVSSGSQNLPAIPHSLTTLQQYLAHLKNVFWGDIPCSSDSDHNSRGEASTVNHNDDRECRPLSHHSSRRDDLPTPAALADILQSTRQLLAEHVEERMLRLAGELENDANLAGIEMRSNVQSRAFRTGFFLQNLGSLFLELGRTTMTLRMGQVPAEAVVNAGPAVFISASGPNPVMVQPVPFYPAPSFGGMDMGSTTGYGPEDERGGSAVLPRNIDIRIHAVPIPAASQSGMDVAQLQQENSDSTRTSADNDSVHHPVRARTHSATLTGEFGLRVVPVRTVVAMPAGISNSQSNNLVPLLHPLLSRIRQQNNGTVNDALNPQASSFHQGGIEANQVSVSDSVRQILESYIGGSVPETRGVPSYTMPVVSGPSMPPTAQIEHQGTRVYITSQQMPNSFNESSHVNDGEDAGQGSLPQYLNIFNQPSNTVLLGQQVNVGGVNQQVSALGSRTEQESTEMDAELNQASVSVNDQGLLFSSYLRQLMPLLTQERAISQDVSNPDSNSLTVEAHRVDCNDPSSSQRKRDPPEPPSPKRHKKE